MLESCAATWKILLPIIFTWQDPEFSFVIPSIKAYLTYLQFLQASVLPSTWQGVNIIINNTTHISRNIGSVFFTCIIISCHYSTLLQGNVWYLEVGNFFSFTIRGFIWISWMHSISKGYKPEMPSLAKL